MIRKSGSGFAFGVGIERVAILRLWGGRHPPFLPGRRSLPQETSTRNKEIAIMKVSMHWLNQFVKVDDVIDPKSLPDQIDLRRRRSRRESSHRAKATNLVIGHILELRETPG
jgi:hypothetical protein